MSKDARTIRLPLLLEPQPEGGYTVTSPAIRGLVTEGDTVAETIENAIDAFYTVLEFYEDNKRPLPRELFVNESVEQSIKIELVLTLQNESLVPA